MLKSLLMAFLAAVISVGATAKAAHEFGNPYAYLTNANGGILVLTDKEDLKRCPPKSALAVATNSEADENYMVGCWVPMRNDKTNKIEIMIAWLPDYNIQWIPVEQFRSFSQPNEECSSTLTL